MKKKVQTMGGAGRPARGQRVVPLPLALVALSLPALIAWALPAESTNRSIRGAHAEARPLDEPFVLLGRDVRVPETPGGYVDVWAEPKGWETGVLLRANRRQ